MSEPTPNAVRIATVGAAGLAIFAVWLSVASRAALEVSAEELEAINGQR